VSDGLPPGWEARISRIPIRSVYVHAPFCARRCFYCDFAVTADGTGDPADWLGALARELQVLEGEGLFTLASSLDTLFVGGGTPSVLGLGAMIGLAEVLGPDRLDSHELEWTGEANPESFTPELAEAWARAGVNRVSLGAQSFQREALRWMGRLHGPGGPARAVALAREAGIFNLTLDLIFGLPSQVARSWEEDLEAALALEVPHLSLYGLSVEPGTPLARAVEGGVVSNPEEDRYRNEFLTASKILRQAGYRQYELSNFALPGYECRHNQAYWDHRPYLGLGNSAHSFLPPLRRWNLRDWMEYQNSVREVGRATVGEEILGAAEVRLERIWLGLRTDDGIPLEVLSPEAREAAEDWVRRGWAGMEGERVVLTPEGWLILDQLAVELAEMEGWGAPP